MSRYRISPSRAAEDWPELTARRIGRVERLLVAHPFRLEAKDLRWDALGIAVHAFLASDVRGLVDGERRERAEALLAGAGLSEVIGTDSVLAVGSALTRWVDARWPAARWLREVPIEVAVPSVHGERRLSGVIDLLLETEGRVVIDHKTFPAAAESAWRARVKDYLPQMSAYAAALEAFGGVPVAGVWVHFALGGGVVEIVR